MNGGEEIPIFGLKGCAGYTGITDPPLICRLESGPQCVNLAGILPQKSNAQTDPNAAQFT